MQEKIYEKKTLSNPTCNNKLHFNHVRFICVFFKYVSNGPSYDGVSYRLNDDGRSYYVADITDMSRSEIIISPAINDFPVTSIGNQAFSNKTNLTSIIIPDSVTDIDQYEFENCSGITHLKIGNGLDSLGTFAFAGCSGLANITVNKYNYEYESVNNCLIIKYSGELILGCKNSVIPDNVNSIGYGAFYGCSGLTSITIPDRVKEIEGNAFCGCSGLTRITVNDNNPNFKSVNNCILSKDGTKLILGCKSSVIPEGVTSIEEDAFAGTDTSISIPDSVNTILSGAFSGCKELTKITIPDRITIISRSLFSGCSGLKSVTIPAGVVTIESYAFSGCKNLTDINFKGTKAQWNTIKKGFDWDKETLHCTVHCIDGDITKQYN